MSRPGKQRPAARSGIVLLLVLLVVAMLALGAYSFSYLMNTEAQAAKSYGRLVQARAAADSAIHYVLAVLTDQQANGTLGMELYDSPDMFHAVEVASNGSEPLCLFSIVAPQDDAYSASASPIRYGLMDESARINLNALAASVSSQATESQQSASEESTAEEPVNPLLYLPNMTSDVADAILDWIDPDDEPRAEGAESDYYLSLDPPYQAKNGPLDSLDELLLVRGVTPRLLYGEDVNLNGLLDPNEDDGDTSYPIDDANGELDRGWLPFLTLYSQEQNKDMIGQERINLNSDDLEALYDQLSEEPDFGEEVARFVVAWRLFGPAESEQERQSEGAGGPSGPGAGPGSDTGTQQPSDDQQQQDQTEKSIAGLDASGGAKHKLESALDLIDATVNARLAGAEKDETTRLESPLKKEDLDQYIEALLDRTTTTDQTAFVGRINVNTAPFEVLMAVPGMTEELADSIVTARWQEMTDGSETFYAGRAWLLTSGTLSLEQFKKFENYFTGRSQVFRIQAIGYFDRLGTAARVEAVVDLTGPQPRIRVWRDLTPLGRGYDPRQLLLEAGFNVTATTAR